LRVIRQRAGIRQRMISGKKEGKIRAEIRNKKTKKGVMRVR
jgi:hypothetical protein